MKRRRAKAQEYHTGTGLPQSIACRDGQLFDDRQQMVYSMRESPYETRGQFR